MIKSIAKTILVLFCAIIIAIGCGDDDDSDGSGAGSAPERISVSELKKLIDGETDVVVVDTRGEGSYDQGHIPGAVLMTYSAGISSRHAELSKDATIVLYCA